MSLLKLSYLSNVMENKFDQFASLSAQISHIYASLASQYGLTINELHVLYYIGSNGPSSPGEICKKWSLPKQTITSISNKLAKMGYLCFSTDPIDKRSKRIILTDSGEKFVLPLIESITQSELKTSREFGEEKFASLLKQLSQLQNLLAHHLNHKS
ncbi:MarR family winged helix-turn-helix transcriptional regulator [Neobacillus sp. LXY-1]|uniref:MarR family winged helix-turn-helix transcriptional regulator n=1 Tax=Neobacillus sp. LXY-1 TaxID=3379133 RepID=UPI003EE031E6